MPRHAADDETARWYSFEGVPVHTPEVLAALDGCKPAEGGLAIDLEGHIVEVIEVQEWRSRFNSLASRFSIWCRSAALCPSVPEMRAYFGWTSRAMSFSGQELIWPECFDMQREAIAAENGRDVFDEIEQQLAFEDQSGLAQLLNPALFPPRDYLLAQLGGFDAFERHVPSPFGRHAGLTPDERAHNDEVDAYNAIRERWAEESRTQRGEMMMASAIDEACAAYAKGDFNARAPFDAHADRMGKWAAPLIPEGLPEGAARRIAARLALATLVDKEYELVSAVQQLTAKRRSDPEPLDRSRLERLRAGTTSIPQLG
jgi:hypothetical protein